jgi:hypothetical protein
MEIKNSKSLGCIRKSVLRSLSLDLETLEEEFEDRYGKLYRFDFTPKAEIEDFAWRYILGNDYNEVFQVRNEILDTLSDSYVESCANDNQRKELRRRFLEKNNLI